MKNFAKFFQIILASLCGGLLLVLLLAWCVFSALGVPKRYDGWFRPRESQPFQSGKWLMTEPGDPARFLMANDLVSSKQLVGRQYPIVTNLLGEPSFHASTESGIKLYYGLVPQKDFPARSAFLPKSSFWNTEAWHLVIFLKYNRVCAVAVRAG